jgi:arylsulfatase A-like enzyme
MHSAPRVLSGLLALALAAACTPEPPPHTQAPRDLLLVTVDTLRPDHLGIYGYERPTSPNLDRFFADGAIHERAYATAAHTSPSVVSLLSGLYPDEHRVRLIYQLVPEETAVLPQLLPEAFTSAAFVSNVVLTDEAIGLAGRFDHYDDFIDERESSRKIYERGARRSTDAALEWLAAEGKDAERLFLWVHYIDPHGPYRAPEGWRDRFDHAVPRPMVPSRVPAYQRDPGIYDGLHYVDRYDEEIAYWDEQFGRLVEGFAAVRDLDRTLVVMTADHGESMMEHENFFTHGYHVYEEIIRVPLLLRGPGVRAGRSQIPVSIVDVAPTLLAAVGARTPEAWSGADLRRVGADPPKERLLWASGGNVGGEVEGWLAGIAGQRKVLVGLSADGSVVERRAYDLAADAGETAPLTPPQDDPLLARVLERAARDPDPGGVPRDYRQGLRLDAPKVRPEVSPQARDLLRALGYVE